MCGICGFVRSFPQDQGQDELTLSKMCVAIQHRGPDAQAWRSFSGQVFLGHLRLSIIDLSEAANQPLSNEDGTIWIIFNGEIYNFQPLRQELLAKGHKFSSAGDTEVLIHLYEEMGPDMLSRLNGMFAFALWDDRQKRLFCARDNFGIKPFYYCLNDDGLTFASEIKALLARPENQAAINPLALWQSLSFRYVPGEHTLFSGVHKLLPGHFLTWCPGEQPKIKQWFDAAEYRASFRVQDVTTEQVRQVLAEAVERQMIADVPVGSFLSGGLDSSLITALMCRVEEPMRPVRTYTVGYEGHELPATSPVDRVRYVTELAQQYPLETQFIDPIIKPGDSLDLATLRKIVWHLEEPVYDGAILNAMRVAQLARQHQTKVLLCGHGADEVFGGYRRHRAAGLLHYTRAIPTPILQLAGRASSLLPHAYRHTHFLNVATQRPPEDLLNISFLNLLPHTRSQLSEDFLNGCRHADALSYHKAVLANYPARDLTDAAMLVDQLTFLVDQNLLYMDKLSMAYSLETRVPFLDLELVALGAQLSSNSLVTRGQLKAILYQAAEPLLPETILQRPKSGFGIYVNSWWGQTKPAWYADIMSGVRSRGWFNGQQIRQTEQQAEVGHTAASELLFSVLLSEIWAQQFLD